jgi:hypothetical protein
VKKCHKPVGCCEKTCGCEKSCESKCHKLYRRPVVELLESLFGSKKSCEAGCEVCGCGGSAPAAAPAKAPANAPEAAPLPAAPKADPSAAIPSGIYESSGSLVRN